MKLQQSTENTHTHLNKSSSRAKGKDNKKMLPLLIESRLSKLRCVVVLGGRQKHEENEENEEKESVKAFES